MTGRHLLHVRVSPPPPRRVYMPELGRTSRLTRPAHILLYLQRVESLCFVDLVRVSPVRSSWWDAAFAFTSVEQGKRDKH